MEVTHETRKLTSIGLSNVVVKDLEISRCGECGEEEIAFPRIEELHRLVARCIVEKKGKLHFDEIRFLRKYLGWSGADFARHFGVAPETVSRWEHGKAEMGGTAERLLRLSVVHWSPVDEYPIERLDSISDKVAAKPLKLSVEHKRNGWDVLASA